MFIRKELKKAIESSNKMFRNLLNLFFVQIEYLDGNGSFDDG